MSEGHTRAEHLARCKQRALEYVDRGELQDAVASMGSDLGKHPETKLSKGSILMQLPMVELINGTATRDSIRRWVEGFN